jgi:maleate isomerase
VISPCFPVSDNNVTLFFQDCGFDVVRFRGLKCTRPVAISQVQEDELRKHVAELDGDDVDAFVQVGANLSMCSLCVELGQQHQKALYRHQCGYLLARSSRHEDQRTGRRTWTTV